MSWRALCLALLCASGVARAEDVAIVTDDVPLARRTGAELGALGLSSEQVFDAGEVDIAELARQRTASFVLAFAPDGAGVRVTLLDRVTGKTIVRTLIFDPSEERDALLSLGAVELLHASLLELTRAPAHGDAPLPTALAAPPGFAAPPAEPATSRRAGLLLGGAVSHAAGALVHVRTAVDVAITPRVSLVLASALPLYEQRVAAAAGEGGLWSASLWLGARADVLHVGRFTPSVGAGLAGLYARARGFSDQPSFAGRESRGVSGGPGVEAGVDVRLGARTSLRLDAQLAYALARLDVKIDRRTVAQLGQPWFLAALALRVAL